MTIQSFEDLLGSVSKTRFLEDIRGKKWLHTKNSTGKANLVGWDDITQLLNMEVWNHQNLLLVQDTVPVSPKAYCQQTVDRTGSQQLVPVFELVGQHLGRGASLVLNEVESLLPKIRLITDAITSELNSKVSANIYVSQKNHQAFGSHYDKTDVYVLQTLGSKRWRIYEGQIESPVLHPMFRGESKEQLTKLKGKVEQEFVMNAGDLLYLPRGRFHDALATEGPSIHISIAVSEPKGLDYVNLIMNEVVAEPLFRDPIPANQVDMEAHFDRLADRLKVVASSSRVKSKGARLHQHFGKTRPKLQVGRRAKNGN